MGLPEEKTSNKLGATAGKSGVFLRQSTGLVKNVSLLDAISLNVCTQATGVALATISLTMLLLPSVAGVNLVYASLIAFLIMIPQIIVYTMLSRRLARTGGDYVWTSRTLGGLAGGTLAFAGYTAQSMSFEALLVISAVLAIGSVGLVLGNSSFLGLALPGNVPGSEPLLQFLLGSAIFAALIVLNVVRPRYGFKVVSICVIIGIVTLIVANLTLLNAGTTGVANYINSLKIQGVTYQSVAQSYSGSNFDLVATLSFLPFFALFVYPWSGAPAVGSELKRGRAMNWNVPMAAVVSFILVTGSLANLYYVGGFAFTNAALANPTLVFNYSFNLWTLAMGVSNNFALSLFIGLGWILWNIGILAFGVIIISRYLFAQSFDRFLPASLAYISPRYSSPVMAHLVDLVVTIVLVALASFFYGTLTSLYGTTVAAMIYFIFVGVTAVIYALRHEIGASKIILATAGVLSAVVFFYLTVEFLAYPGIWGGNLLAYGFEAAAAISAVLIYLASRSYYAKRSIDISLAYREIPPE